MTAFTRLESVALEALAWDLSDEIPSIGAQIRAARPGRRRNTGFGLFTDLESPASVGSGASGDFGTVHVMVGSLRDPIAFKARVRDGRLLGLVGDSYLQDTRAIDFERVAFDQVFTIDADGRSVTFVPSAPPGREAERVAPRPVPPAAPPKSQPQRASLPTEKRTTTPQPAASRPAPALTKAAPTKAAQTPTAPARPSPSGSSKSTAYVDKLLDDFASDVTLAEPTGAERAGLIIAVWAVPLALAAILVSVFDAPIAIFVLAFIVARYLQRPRGLEAVRRGLTVWRRHLESSKAAR